MKSKKFPTRTLDPLTPSLGVPPMKWTDEANEAVSKVPFFIRKRVRKRVEEEASRCGASEVCLEHVKACQKRFLIRMEDEVTGYQVETCFGPTGCPNRAVIYEDFSKKVEDPLAQRELKSFLKEKVKGPLKMHHEFRVSISDCPNACSRPQIADLGLIGARSPKVTDDPCSRCRACVQVCRERAISLQEDKLILDPSQLPLLRPVHHCLSHRHPPGKGKGVPHFRGGETGPPSPAGGGNSRNLWNGRNLASG